MPARVAAGTIATATFVKLDTASNNHVVNAGANGSVYGISQVGGRTAPTPDVTTDPPEAAQSGEHLNIHESGEECLLRIGTGGVTAGDLIESAADGTGITAATTAATVRNIGARALETAAAGTLSRVLVFTDTKTNPA